MSDTPQPDLTKEMEELEDTNRMLFERYNEVRRELAAANARCEELEKDKERLDWLESVSERGANTLAHRVPNERGHVYTNVRWEKQPDGTRVAQWDHFYAPSVRAAIDAARTPPTAKEGA